MTNARVFGKPSPHRALWPLTVLLIGSLATVACGDAVSVGDGGAGTEDPSDGPDCDIDPSGLTSDALRNAIESLSNPPLTRANTSASSYLDADDRVIGLLIGETPLAVPHSIMEGHEVANFDDWAGRSLVVTYCLNTGSSLAFDRGAVNGAEFGVSGLLLHQNLVMFDRRPDESLWPQMSRRARCGPDTGLPLEEIPIIEMRWKKWRDLHPSTQVLARSESSDPVSTVERHHRIGPESAAATSPDGAPEPKERVLGIPDGPGGLALPFGTLDNGDPVRTVEVTVGGTSMVVFWDREGRAAMAFRPALDGESLSFTVEDERIVDRESGSVWTVDGRAVDGRHEGRRLEPVDEAYVAFVFAWEDFQPETEVWQGAP